MSLPCTNHPNTVAARSSIIAVQDHAPVLLGCVHINERVDSVNIDSTHLEVGDPTKYGSSPGVILSPDSIVGSSLPHRRQPLRTTIDDRNDEISITARCHVEKAIGGLCIEPRKVTCGDQERVGVGGLKGGQHGTERTFARSRIHHMMDIVETSIGAANDDTRAARAKGSNHPFNHRSAAYGEFGLVSTHSRACTARKDDPAGRMGHYQD